MTYDRYWHQNDFRRGDRIVVDGKWHYEVLRSSLDQADLEVELRVVSDNDPDKVPFRVWPNMQWVEYEMEDR